MQHLFQIKRNLLPCSPRETKREIERHRDREREREVDELKNILLLLIV